MILESARRSPTATVVSVIVVVVSALVGWAINLVMESPAGLSSWTFLILTLVLAGLSYVVSQSERSARDREGRTDELLAPLDDLMRKGVLHVAGHWNQDLVQFQHPAGQRLRQLIETDRESTWYVISVSPQGLLPWIDYYGRGRA